MGANEKKEGRSGNMRTELRKKGLQETTAKDPGEQTKPSGKRPGDQGKTTQNTEIRGKGDPIRTSR